VRAERPGSERRASIKADVLGIETSTFLHFWGFFCTKNQVLVRIFQDVVRGLLPVDQDIPRFSSGYESTFFHASVVTFILTG
jgi:hypothetical protein